MEKQEEAVELTLDNMNRPEAYAWMGAYAARSIEEFGCSIFYVDQDGKIRAANPAGVYIQPGADATPPNTKITFVRPIVGTPQPRWIAWRDGQPWEVVYEPLIPASPNDNSAAESTEKEKP